MDVKMYTELDLMGAFICGYERCLRDVRYNVDTCFRNGKNWLTEMPFEWMRTGVDLYISERKVIEEEEDESL